MDYTKNLTFHQVDENLSLLNTEIPKALEVNYSTESRETPLTGDSETDNSTIATNSIEISNDRLPRSASRYEAESCSITGDESSEIEQGSSLLSTAQESGTELQRDSEELSVGDRKQTAYDLGRELSNTLGTYYIDESNLNEGDRALKKNRLTLCITSLHPQRGINPADWKGCILILDKFVQLINHIFSGTISDRGIEIMNNFKEILKNASKVIMMDADSDLKALEMLNIAILIDLQTCGMFVLKQ